MDGQQHMDPNSLAMQGMHNMMHMNQAVMSQQMHQGMMQQQHQHQQQQQQHQHQRNMMYPGPMPGIREPKRLGRPPKVRDTPKKPMSAYASFVQEKRPYYNRLHPNKTFKEIAQMVGQEWRETTPEQRTQYVDIANHDRQRYDREKHEYSERAAMRHKMVEEGPKRKGPRKKSKLAPKNPLSGYTCFVKEVRGDVQAHNPDKGFADVARLVGSMWKELGPEQREKYDKMAEDDKKRYDLEKAKYNLRLHEIQSLPQGKRNKKRTGPKKAISAYTFFVMDQRATVAVQNPTMSFKEVAQRVGFMWRNLDETSKQKYIQRAADDRERYELEKANFL